MLKELKYFFFILIIFIFIFFIGRYYFSDQNKKNIYRSINTIDQNIEKLSENLHILKSDTDNIIEYIENDKTKEKKKYYFWELLLNND
jgi:ABC-type dipeptide/oligopeptide/nickel transport system permease component